MGSAKPRAGAGPTFGEQVLAFNAGLSFDAPLPPGIEVMNPFQGSPCALAASAAFYRKYYADHRERHIILGINPGRFGAGLTGVPFTDPKRLASACGIHIAACAPAHEPSSVFVYEVIDAMGGPEAFYRDWYINSICPLGFVRVDARGRKKNYNYYDDRRLEEAATPFMVECLRRQLAFGIRRDVCYCLGTGKNAAFIERLNAEHGFFGRVVPLEHPRYVMQYKSKELGAYVRKYVTLLGEAAGAAPVP
ncbi:uracil-DNA glycosylase family protein [Desulfovibrio sp. ZJ209]|uniref:uracil-DNA glycosylase family protein n=1 Tax=Desulfovibrio sp. ZJ209 TaxID=2709794 RepID=UPI0013EA54CD|nr:uracil-DNA glycosylase family protein [Desulfovibrio sp. ZJ209]